MTEQMYEVPGSRLRELADLVKERDRFLAVLEGIVDSWDNPAPASRQDVRYQEAVRAARAVLREGAQGRRHEFRGCCSCAAPGRSPKGGTVSKDERYEYAVALHKLVMAYDAADWGGYEPYPGLSEEAWGLLRRDYGGKPLPSDDRTDGQAASPRKDHDR